MCVSKALSHWRLRSPPTAATQLCCARSHTLGATPAWHFSVSKSLLSTVSNSKAKTVTHVLANHWPPATDCADVLCRHAPVWLLWCAGAGAVHWRSSLDGAYAVCQPGACFDPFGGCDACMQAARKHVAHPSPRPPANLVRPNLRTVSTGCAAAHHSDTSPKIVGQLASKQLTSQPNDRPEPLMHTGTPAGTAVCHSCRT